MEMARKILLLLSSILLLPLLLALPSSSDVPSHGCYWTKECQSKWFGACGAGHIAVDQSGDCHGLCTPPCLPFHTHFYCCIPERPKAIEECSRCRKKLDFGEEFICCADCSDAYILDKNKKIGYCKTGSQLTMQLKPHETFKWVAGPWMKCSLPCAGGVRYRDVDCFGSMEDSTIPHYPVDDSKCSADEMPPRQEFCNTQSCVDNSVNDTSTTEKSSMSGWLITLLVLLGLIAIGGLGFAGYIYYRRWNLAPHGYVYIMLDGYS